MVYKRSVPSIKNDTMLVGLPPQMGAVRSPSPVALSLSRIGDARLPGVAAPPA
jgi:hypothetical protein